MNILSSYGAKAFLISDSILEISYAFVSRSKTLISSPWSGKELDVADTQLMRPVSALNEHIL